LTDRGHFVEVLLFDTAATALLNAAGTAHAPAPRSSSLDTPFAQSAAISVFESCFGSLPIGRGVCRHR
jgi:hypothetical protein